MAREDYPITKLMDEDEPFFNDMGRSMSNLVRFNNFTMGVRTVLDKRRSVFNPRKTPSLLYLTGSEIKLAYREPGSVLAKVNTSTEVLTKLAELGLIDHQLALTGLTTRVRSLKIKHVPSRDKDINRYDIRAKLLDFDPPIIKPEINSFKRGIGLDIQHKSDLLLQLGTISTLERTVPISPTTLNNIKL